MDSQYSEHHDQVSDLGLKTLRMRRRLYLVSFIVVLGVILFFAGQMLNVLAVPIGILIWALIIIFCLRPIVNFLETKKINRLAGTAIAYVIMCIVLLIIGYLLFSPVFGFKDQFDNLLDTIPYYVEGIKAWFNGFYADYSHILQDYRVNEWVNEALNTLMSSFTGAASASAENVIQVGSSIVGAALTIGFALVVAFWILMELPALGREFRRIAGPKYQEDITMLSLVGTRVMGGYIKATLIQCFIIGVLCGIGFAVMGIPNAAALGVITGLLNIIPVIGPWFGGALAAVVGVFVSPGIAVAALVYTIVMQQLVYTFISPKIMGDSVDIHPALVILALMTGSALGTAVSGLVGGLVGALASIPLIAAAKSIFVYYFEKKTNRKIVSEDGVFFQGKSEHGDKADPVNDATAYATGKINTKELEIKLSELRNDKKD